MENQYLTFDLITDHLLKDINPSYFLQEISERQSFREDPFQLLYKLKDTEQSVKYHPEGSAWNHTMLVVDEAALVRHHSKDPKVFLWSALLHDIGKPDTTRVRKGRITSYDHDTVGARLATEFLKNLTDDGELIRQVTLYVRYHMHMLYVLKKLPFGNLKGMIKDVDLDELALLCRCDRLGRIGADREKEEENYLQFLEEVKSMLRKV